MPQISIIAESTALGPSVPSEHGAWLSDREWLGGERVKVLNMQIGDCHLTVWPADVGCIARLGNKLLDLAEKLKRQTP